MRALAYAATIAVLFGGLAGCVSDQDAFGKPGAGYVENVAAHLKGVDWGKEKTVTVGLSEYSFSPAKLTFRRGVPYRLRLENRGGVVHFFASEGFFKAIAARRLTTPKGAVDTPYLKSIAVAPGTAKELEFVAVKAGTYGLKCTAPFHAVFGMTGTLRIL